MAEAESPALVTGSTVPVQSIEVERDVKQEDEGDEGSDADAPNDGDDANAKVSNELYKHFKNITEALLNLRIKVKNNEEHYPSTLFKRLPNKRNLPDYYQIITEPSAISTLRGKIQRKTYTGVPEFVRDFALIVQNAQIYNRPNSAPVRDVLRLDALFREELKRLVTEGLTTEEDIEFPKLGEIPYATPEPDPVSEDEDGDEEGEEEEEEEDADDSDEERRRKRGRRGVQGSAGGKKIDREEEEENEKGVDGEQKRRGRPPKVDTPMEARIKNILKGIRKLKSEEGDMKVWQFEKLPDKAEHPAYYQVIKDPMALDAIKKKAKRKKYQSVEQFMKDVELMFDNAMRYNEDGSTIHTYAKDLLSESKRVEAEERAKPDSEYLQASDGRIPLPFISYKNEIWKVGDWIHIQNPNDVTKPIIAQIYRTWRDGDGQEWINACWYYRPEQTIHQFEKHFFPNEVVKTGQYRDHRIEEVVDKCFVMFFTRYSRGRPRNLPSGSEVYVCEARYNEDKSKFNKIKTWASCLPDEVRDKDYEMDLFDAPRRIKKIPSPLKHLLKDEMKETDELPQPQWGHPNAPPIVGGIHKQTRDENQSPPPEPTPPPQPLPPPPAARTPSVSMQPAQQSRPPFEHQSHSAVGNPAPITRPSPSMTPQPTSYQSAPVPSPVQYNRQQSYSGASHSYTSATVPPQTPSQQQNLPYAAQQQLHGASLAAAHPGNYAAPVPNYVRPGMPVVPPLQYGGYSAPSNQIHRTPEAYILSDSANESIPKGIRDQFPQDDQGRLLFFTQPPLNTHHMTTGSSMQEQDTPLQHTNKHVNTLAERLNRTDQLKRKREHLESAIDHDSEVATADPQLKVNGIVKSKSRDAPEMQAGTWDEMPLVNGDRDLFNTVCAKAENLLAVRISNGTQNQYKTRFGKTWEEALAEDMKASDSRTADMTKEQKRLDMQRMTFNACHLAPKSNFYDLNKYGYLGSWQKDFWTGRYDDDHDSSPF